jgi:catecholate siderophore receptor
MLRSRLPALSLSLITFAAAPHSAFAQTASSLVESPSSLVTLRGVILDPTRAPVPGARITVKSERTAAGSSAISDERGAFAVKVPSGPCVLTVAAAGFQPVSQMLDASDAQLSPHEFVLAVAGLHETVTVSASAGPYDVATITSGTKTETPLRDVPQSITLVTKDLIRDQLMLSVADVVRYVPGIGAHQGENNRDQVVIRGNNSSADFFLNGVRDDAPYHRDLYNLERVEALKGPNAMIFGRGGGGGVINRVSKEPEFSRLHDVSAFGGAFDHKRVTADFNQPVTDRVAVRVNGVYETSGSFRDAVGLERHGLNPTLTMVVAPETRITIGYEHFRDHRVADRGIPSFQGRPADADISTYFGNPADSHVNARVNLTSASLKHRIGAVSIQNRTVIGDYERAYQNFVPGPVSADKTWVSLTAYNNDTSRQNLFNQTDVTVGLSTGRVRHTLLGGAEVGRQLTDNFRNTGYFNDATTSILIPYANPTVSVPVTFRQSATDADNRVRAAAASAYVQDQIELSRFLQVLAGLRLEAFDLHYHDNRTGTDLGREDRLLSPRAGLVLKPIPPMSLYGSFSVSHLPSSGDQFSSLTMITEQVKPERFANYEAGVKWDVRPSLFLTTALYRLDRTNTRSTDPNDPTRIVQTGSQRTNGYELGLTGRITPSWQIAGGYAWQRAFVTSATITAAAGARAAQVPRHTLSLWNAVQVHPKLGFGLGIVGRTDMYAAIDNAVTLPGYADVEAAVYLTLSARLRLQTNVENLFDRIHYVNAASNTNISPGSPRAIRAGVTARF